ncbi:MAG: hypothetical protein B7Y80_01590 [Hyphomicrobium sp. 32-62-53]|nr:MAG: hypothetical protein B7Z29_01940 [Hyphomicrobium sp. 12-62-95]OYY01447.1 MAG: hypothetical protein B7Y80_01590 [Hyphomicrobium sp. 32-62-53]
MTATEIKIDGTLEVDGDRWRVLAIGATREDGAKVVHLASLTRSRQQRNGAVPVQALGWLTTAGALEPVNL